MATSKRKLKFMVFGPRPGFGGDDTPWHYDGQQLWIGKTQFAAKNSTTLPTVFNTRSGARLAINRTKRLVRRKEWITWQLDYRIVPIYV